MKIDRHNPRNRFTAVKLRAACDVPPQRKRLWLSVFAGACFVATFLSHALGDLPATANPSAANHGSDPGEASSQPEAIRLLRQVLHTMVHGPAFDAKVRETVWTNAREVVGVGTYEQAGGGSGRFHLQLTMHDGDGKHRLQQISDGRLAWTRTEIAGNVELRRVDVGRLDEWVRGANKATTISPRLLVGAWAELLSTIERDYNVQLAGAKLKDDPVWVITGTLKPERREQILADSGRDEWPVLHPTRVRVAVRSTPDPQTGIGNLFPVRIEFWSDPVTASAGAETPALQDQRRLITLIELYSLRPIAPPPPQRFRFENHDAEVNFVNETDRYIQLYGVRLTQRQRRQLRR